MKYFDLHCDTLHEFYHRNQSLEANSLHISLNKAERVFEKYSQVLAIWSPHTYTEEEAYSHFFSVWSKYKSENINKSFFTPYLMVEGGKLLCGDIGRLTALRACGVRFLTLVWGGNCCIGGAHDTDNGLTSFGISVVKKCFELGIVVDLSHASEKMFHEAVSLADEYEKPIIASHSCSAALNKHTRNLTDEMFLKIKARGGIVGVSFVPEHLKDGGNADITDVVRHIGHFISQGGEDNVCIGSDFDGVAKLPRGITGIADIPVLSAELSKAGFNDRLIDKILYENADSFMKKYIKKQENNK